MEKMNKIQYFLMFICFGILTNLFGADKQGIQKGYDLQGEWRFIAGDNAGYSGMDVDESGWQKVNLPEKIKPMKAGWYRYHIQLPEVDGREKNYLSTQILIGNIVGNSEVYFNGHLIGIRKGSGIYSEGWPQSFTISSQSIRFGLENVIAIKVAGCGGGSEIGITRGPIVLAPLGDSYLYDWLHSMEEKYSLMMCRFYEADIGKNKSADKTRGLAEMFRDAREIQGDQKLAALAKKLKQIETEIPKTENEIIKRQKKRSTVPADMPNIPENAYQSYPGFGMLGRLFNDGLMIYNSSPAGFEYKYGADAPYSVQYCGVTPTRIYPIRMGWIAKTIRVEGKRDNEDVSYDVTHSAAFPGIMVNVNDSEFSFTFSNAHVKCPDYFGYQGEGGRILIGPVNPAIEGRITKIRLNVDIVNAPMTRNWLVFWFTGRHGTLESFPMEVICENPMEQMTLSENAEGKTVITLKSDGRMGHLVFINPLGMQGLSGEEANYFQLRFPREFTETLNFWGYASLQVPIGCKEKYFVNEQTQMVDVLDQFEYEILDDGWNAGRVTLAPIPPVLSNAMLHGYPVNYPYQGKQKLPAKVESNKIYPGLNLLMKTKYGEYGAFASQTFVRYQLPIPPMNVKKMESLPGEQKISDTDVKELKKLINESVKELCSPTAPNGVDRAFKGNVQAWMAYKYLDDNNKSRLWQSATTATLKTFDPDIWNLRIEPFSQTPYLWTYFLEGPYYEMYDMDWGNGLSIYGFEKYARYSGDSNSVKYNWDKLKSVFRLYDAANSWVWMSVSNSDIGHGTGAGDCLSVTYSASLAMANMAKQMNDDSTYQAAIFQAAKTSVPMLTRFWMNEYARDNKMISPDVYVIGYFEDDGVLSVSKKDDPWYMTSVLSGDGVEPEVFDLYMKYGKETLKEYEKKFDEFYPNWFDGNYKYHQSLTYPDNSGYTTLPHIYSRFRLHYPKSEILKDIRMAQKNREMWWGAPHVLGQILEGEE